MQNKRHIILLDLNMRNFILMDPYLRHIIILHLIVRSCILMFRYIDNAMILLLSVLQPFGHSYISLFLLFLFV